MVQPPDEGLHQFLNGLRRPCGHLINAFREMGIETSDDVDTLSLTGNQHLEQMKKHLVDRGMSLFLWMVIREGLRERAEALEAR